MLQTIRHLLELIRFSHTLFALPFAMLAAVMAWHATSIDARLYNFLIEAEEIWREQRRFWKRMHQGLHS